jgi:hypothetical protein
MPKSRDIAPPEDRTARLTLLIDPRKKDVFERICASEDVTPSQVVRRLIRDYIETRLGHPWTTAEQGPERDAAAKDTLQDRRRPRRR